MGAGQTPAPFIYIEEGNMKSFVRQAANALVLRCPWFEVIENDLYGIAERITKVEPHYFIVRNRNSGTYEVHSADNKVGTYCFTVPYDSLDARTLEYCKQTLVANTDRLLREMEEKNKKIDEARQRSFKSTMEDASYETAEELKTALERDSMHDTYKRTHRGVTI